MDKVYLFLADGFEEIEGLTVVDLLRRANIDITMVSITGNLKITGSHRIVIQADEIFENIDFRDAVLLVLPGGMPGAKNLLNHEGLDALLKEHTAKGKAIAAICAAPMVLGEKGLLKGRKATCFPGFEENLIGAQIEKAEVVVDGNITTSKGMGTAMDFGLTLINHLKGKEEADKIAGAIQYQYYK
ncbi:MAG: DJ-1 family glyoxalase III [Mobilitalea sp.]